MDPYLSSKQGDFVAIQKWVEEHPSHINDEDEHMRSVLYYAGLCGHEGIVRYLMTKGALVGKFDAVSALTNEIRLILETNNPNLVFSKSQPAEPSLYGGGEPQNEFASLAKEGFYVH